MTERELKAQQRNGDSFLGFGDISSVSTVSLVSDVSLLANEAGCISAALGPPQRICLSHLHSRSAGLVKSSIFNQSFIDSSDSVLV